MNLSISNIAWLEEEDEKVYRLMNKYHIKGLEIAPTRFFKENPYNSTLEQIKKIKRMLEEKNIEVVAMQSILFGRDDLKLFESKENRKELLEYLKKAVDFSNNIGAKVLVFGSPKNRIMKNIDKDYSLAIDFFRTIGKYANNKGVCLCIEANPKDYNTNFINTTQEAFELVKAVESEGFGLHIDFGTMIINNEDIDFLLECNKYIKHIHISEPYLEKINEYNYEKHNKLYSILKSINYNNWISIEMKKTSEECNIDDIESVLKYVSNIFGG